VNGVRPARGSDGGSALIEFTLLATVLMVPFVYAVLCVFEVQRAAYALTAASREAGRAFVTAPDGVRADERARGAADLVLADHGVPSSTGVRIECSETPCLSPGARVTVVLTTSVRLPFVPAWGDGRAATVPVRARHTEVVDGFREARP